MSIENRTNRLPTDFQQNLSDEDRKLVITGFLSLCTKNMYLQTRNSSFSAEIRRIIYTTNPIESYNRQLRKVTKNRSLFPTDMSVLKLLYLASQDILKKWTMKIKHWNKILAQLSIHFKEIVEEYL
jgi:transposase-like protein